MVNLAASEGAGPLEQVKWVLSPTLSYTSLPILRMGSGSHQSHHLTSSLNLYQAEDKLKILPPCVSSLSLYTLIFNSVLLTNALVCH